MPLYWEKWKKIDSFLSQQMMNPNVGCRWREDEEGDKEGERERREGGTGAV